MSPWMKKALFLDRDGVINVDHAYVFQRKNFQFVSGIFDLCRAAKSHGFLIFVITNQAGIGRGYYTEQDFQDLTQWMKGVFTAEGAALDGVYHCPSHPVHGIGEHKIDSPMRKPAPGMILKAAKEFGLDLPNSVLVGDKESDILAGRAAGIKCNLLYRPRSDGENPTTQAIAVLTHLTEAGSYLGHESR